MVALPADFLRWNYFPRRKALLELIDRQLATNADRFFLESTRHNPALCTAFQKEDGEIFVNAKIVGAGYVTKEKHMYAATKALEEHLEYGDKLFTENQAGNELERNSREYQRRGASLLLEHLYFEHPTIATERIDFGANIARPSYVMSRLENFKGYENLLFPWLFHKLGLSCLSLCSSEKQFQLFE